MTSFATDFANLFNQRNNIDPDETVIGKVISTNPITVSIFNGAVLLVENKKLYVNKNLGKITGTVTVNRETGTTTIDNSLQAGESVACIPINKGQSYIAAIKV